MSQPTPFLPPLARVLPAPWAEQLRRASLTENPPGDPLARLKAVEEVTRRAKLFNPQHFRSQP